MDLYKLSHWEFASRVNVFNPAVELLDTFTSYSDEILVRCKFCNKEYKMPSYVVQNGQVHRLPDSRNCKRPAPTRYYNAEKMKIQDMISSIYRNVHRRFELLSYYESEDSPIHLRCVKCGTTIDVLPKKAVSKSFHCPTCYENKKKKKIETEPFDGRDTKIKRSLTRNCHWCIARNSYATCPHCHRLESNTYLIDEFYDRVHPDIILKSDFEHRYKPIQCECRKCGNMWEATPIDLIKGGGCRKCNVSKGESIVASCLDAEKVRYIKEYRFENCKFKRQLRFDFFLPDYNAVIEYDGRQHYVPSSFHGEDPQEAYEDIKKRDKIKNEYCRNNNIRMLRIRYTTKDIQGSVKRYIKRLRSQLDPAIKT